MKIPEIRIYRNSLGLETDLKVEGTRSNDRVSEKMISNECVFSVDVIVVVEGVPKVIYLARRITHPMKGLWCLGRCIYFGDSVQDAFAKNIELDTLNISFSAERFELLSVNHYLWTNYTQGNSPFKIVANLYFLEISKEEFLKISKRLIASQYDKDFGLQPFTREKLVQENAHQAMIDAYDSIWNLSARMRRWVRSFLEKLNL